MNNSNLHAVKHDVDRDEYFTLLDDVEAEVTHYKDQLKGKVIYCNCDDESSAFVKYFKAQFGIIGLKHLIATHYNRDGSQSYRYDFDGFTETTTPLQGDGDYASDECMAILMNEADVIITNPPFSKSKEMVPMLANSGKGFLIVGNINHITFKEIFPLVKDNKLWYGYHTVKSFIKPDGSIKKFGNICWFTNLDVSKRHEDLILYEKYSPEKYPRYDNYDAIDVGAVNTMTKKGKTIYGIPMDYDGVMGVPISFLDKYNPEQFEIVKFRKGNDEKDLSVNGEYPYFRVLVRKKAVA